MDFDNHFRSIQKQQNSLFRVALIGWIIGALVTLAIIVGVAVVAFHFLAKVW
jgi:hypothetical protein